MADPAFWNLPDSTPGDYSLDRAPRLIDMMAVKAVTTV